MKNSATSATTSTQWSSTRSERAISHSDRDQDARLTLFNENPGNFKRTFIGQNQPLMGTGKLMRNPQDVYSTIQLNQIKELKNYAVKLKYAGLVHLCNDNDRRKQITGSMDYQPKLTVQDWVMGVLNKVKEGSPNQWLIQRDESRKHLNYRVTVFQSQANEDNGKPYTTGMADRLILSHYGKNPNEIEVQTGFPITHSQLSTEANNKSLKHVAGTPIKEWQKQTTQAHKAAVSLNESRQPSTQNQATSAGTKTAEKQKQHTPAPNKHVAETVSIMKELFDQLRQAYTQLNVLKMSGPPSDSKAFLESYGFEHKYLGQLSQELSEANNPKLDLTKPDEYKKAHFINHQLFLSETTNELIHFFDDLRGITSAKLCVEVALESMPKLLKTGAITEKDKINIEALNGKLLKHVAQFQGEIHAFLFPLIHGVTDIISQDLDYYKTQQDLATKVLKGALPSLDFIRQYAEQTTLIDFEARVLNQAAFMRPEAQEQKPAKVVNATDSNVKQQTINKAKHNNDLMGRYIGNLLQLMKEHDTGFKKQAGKKYDIYVKNFENLAAIHAESNQLGDTYLKLLKIPGLKENIAYYSTMASFVPPVLKLHIPKELYNALGKSYRDFSELQTKVTKTCPQIMNSEAMLERLKIATPEFRHPHQYESVAKTILEQNTTTINVLKGEFLSHLRSQQSSSKTPSA